MKKGSIAIAIAVLALSGILAGCNAPDTAGYTAPPGDADMKAKSQKMGEDYGKQMQEKMKAQNGGGNAAPAPGGAPPPGPAAAPAPTKPQ